MKRSRAGSSTCTLYIICPNLDNSVSTEFLGLMKKVAKSPLVMDVLNIANVQRQLERLADLLTKIQKALIEKLRSEGGGAEDEQVNFANLYYEIAKYTHDYEKNIETTILMLTQCLKINEQHAARAHHIAFPGGSCSGVRRRLVS